MNSQVVKAGKGQIQRPVQPGQTHPQGTEAIIQSSKSEQSLKTRGRRDKHEHINLNTQEKVHKTQVKPINHRGGEGTKTGNVVVVCSFFTANKQRWRREGSSAQSLCRKFYREREREYLFNISVNITPALLYFNVQASDPRKYTWPD